MVFSSSAHRTETVTTMGHERSVAASCIRLDRKASLRKMLQGLPQRSVAVCRRCVAFA